MAGIRLQPPENFDFSKPDEWPKWKKHFQQFRGASGLSGESDVRQVDTLLYCLGDEADSVLASTNVSQAERAVYATVLEKLDSYFQVRRNTIFERARFNRRCQREGESVEQYITELYSLIEFCAYGDLKEQMLRDRLVVGIRDSSLSEKLQTDPDLTLEKAKTRIMQKAAVQDHQRELAAEQPAAVAAVDRLQQAQPNHRGWSPSKPPGGYHKKPWHYKGGAKCTRCGRNRHQAGETCPAAGVTCHKCNKEGHFGAHCFSYREVASISTEGELQSAFLGALSTKSLVTIEKSSWSVDIHIQDRTVPFKIDTGAEVTAITQETWHRLGEPPLAKPTTALYGPAHQTLDVLGQVTERVTRGQHSSVVRMFVVRGLTCWAWKLSLHYN